MKIFSSFDLVVKQRRISFDSSFIQSCFTIFHIGIKQKQNDNLDSHHRKKEQKSVVRIHNSEKSLNTSLHKKVLRGVSLSQGVGAKMGIFWAYFEAKLIHPCLPLIENLKTTRGRPAIFLVTTRKSSLKRLRDKEFKLLSKETLDRFSINGKNV